MLDTYWFWLDINIKNSMSISLFQSRLLSFIRPNESNIYNIFDPIGLKLLTYFHLGLSHLNEHKFCHNFHDCLNPFCSWSLKIEDTTHYLLHCQHFSNHCCDLISSVKSQFSLILNLWPRIIEQIHSYMVTLWW